MKVLLLAVLSCFVLLARDVHSLHGGAAATLGQHPSQVVINLPNGRFCSGTIIDANHVLTAARCILDDNNELMAAAQTFLRAGAIAAADASMPLSPAVALFPHPLYSPFTGENDIAVIRTQQNFTVVDENNPNPVFAAAERYLRVIPDGTECTVAAWNAPTQALPNPILQTASVSVIGRDQCATQSISSEVFESMMCATSPVAAVTRPAICESNRGAGLFCRQRLVGVVSNGFACATQNGLPGLYTQVRMYDGWIQNQLNRTRIPAAGPTPHPGVDSASSTTVSIVLFGLVGVMTILRM